jgi:pimeloyl-ACP methyl ester carboxylesterase
MEIGVAGFRYDAEGIFPSEIPDAELSSIRCPVLLLLGDREMIYNSSAASERVRRLMPNAVVQVIPNVGHLLGMQRPAVVNPRVVSFLAQEHREREANQELLAG